MEEATRICLVRHGETDWNAERRMQGHIDVPLNAKGLAQAAAAAASFAGVTARAVYSSDLGRARVTAEAIGHALGLPVTLLPALRERCFGRCEGLTPGEVAARFTEEAAALRRRDPEYMPAGGESIVGHQARILACLDELCRCHPGETIVVVTHGGTLDVIHRRVHGMPPQTPRAWPIPNAGLNWLRVRDGRYVIEAWALTDHLELADAGFSE